MDTKNNLNLKFHIFIFHRKNYLLLLDLIKVLLGLITFFKWAGKLNTLGTAKSFNLIIKNRKFKIFIDAHNLNSYTNYVYTI